MQLRSGTVEQLTGESDTMNDLATTLIIETPGENYCDPYRVRTIALRRAMTLAEIWDRFSRRPQKPVCTLAKGTARVTF